MIRLLRNALLISSFRLRTVYQSSRCLFAAGSCNCFDEPFGIFLCSRASASALRWQLTDDCLICFSFLLSHRFVTAFLSLTALSFCCFWNISYLCNNARRNVVVILCQHSKIYNRHLHCPTDRIYDLQNFRCLGKVANPRHLPSYFAREHTLHPNPSRTSLSRPRPCSLCG